MNTGSKENDVKVRIVEHKTDRHLQNLKVELPNPYVVDGGETLTFDLVNKEKDAVTVASGDVITF